MDVLWQVNKKNFIKMEYICTVSFKSERGSYYQVGKIISQNEYDTLSMSERNNFTRKTIYSYNIGSTHNIYDSPSYYYDSTYSHTIDSPPSNSDSFSGFGGGGDFSGGGASGDW